MEQLIIRTPDGKDAATSLKVAEVFGKRHDNVLQDIKALSCSEEFRFLNFQETPYIHPQNGQEYKMYYITKDGFSFLVMGYTGEKAGEFKEKFINEFNKREALLKNDDYILLRSQQILLGRVSNLEKCLTEATQKLEENAPKVLFADSVAASKDCILVKELAAYLSQNGYHIGQNKLYEQLRTNGYLCTKGAYYNLPTQKSIDAGLFEVKKTAINKPDGTILMSTTTLVTGKGSIYFLNWFKKRAA